ncbi:MAG: hypothetical protein TEF_19075 [Rhizobiales bacterium NRL2]|jgi:F-type H+-transporting ATPase subunit b|nr:MAG: hypothetical protein TEF_19075 [Rhizobiales bacterium NRL2]
MFADPTFWVAVAFVLFFALMIYLKLPGKIVAQLDARADRIRGELEEAKRLREEAQSLYADYQRKAEEAVQEADRIVEHAREEAERTAEKMRADMEAALERRKTQAESKIAQAEQQAIDEVRNRAVEIATAAAARILREELKGDAGNRLIDDAIGSVGRHLH